MTDFLDWHPSSFNAQKLYEQRNTLINQILLYPAKAFEKLVIEWNLGKISEIWDDFIFDNIVRPALDQNQNSKLVDSINRYSAINHLLFQTYIRREENPTRFRRAFWNVNSYGLRISNNIQISSSENISDLKKFAQSNRNTKKIAFILKGVYKLAHVEFLHSFLIGCKFFASEVEVHLILIDEKNIDSTDLKHITIHTLGHNRLASKKIDEYVKLNCNEKFDHICWVAAIQDLTLYMGLQLAPSQSYWSMKYHSIIMPTIQKYAGLGFGGESFEFDDVKWYRGRAFPDLQMPIVDKNKLLKVRKRFNIPHDCCLVGCFVRAEKLYDKTFQDSVIRLLAHDSNIHFAIASQALPKAFKQHLELSGKSYITRFHYLGWVDTKQWISNLDIYFDSSPRGSCNTAFEAIEASVPILIADSAHNRESSALPYLLSVLNTNDRHQLSSYGIFSDENERLQKCLEIVDSQQKRFNLAKRQKQIYSNLKGKNYLFAKDYLNYFLDIHLSLAAL